MDSSETDARHKIEYMSNVKAFALTRTADLNGIKPSGDVSGKFCLNTSSSTFLVNSELIYDSRNDRRRSQPLHKI